MVSQENISIDCTYDCIFCFKVGIFCEVLNILPELFWQNKINTVCPRSSCQFHIVTYYMHYTMDNYFLDRHGMSLFFFGGGGIKSNLVSDEKSCLQYVLEVLSVCIAGRYMDHLNLVVAGCYG